MAYHKHTRYDDNDDLSSNSGDDGFWDIHFRTPSPPTNSPVDSPSPPPHRFIDRSNTMIGKLKNRYNMNSANNTNITRATSLQPSKRMSMMPYKPKELWEYEDSKGLEYAITKYKLDGMIRQIAQIGLGYAHADPVNFRFTECFQWRKELEDDYFKKNKKLFIYQEIEINNEIKNYICRVPEYRVLINLGKEIKEKKEMKENQKKVNNQNQMKEKKNRFQNSYKATLA